MRILRTVILAIGLLGLVGACGGGSKKDANEPDNAANPCGGDENEGSANPCGGDDEPYTGGNPCGGW